MQLVSLAMLAVKHAETFDRTYWALLVITVPIVLPCTCGVNLYKSLSDVNFRRVTFHVARKHRASVFSSKGGRGHHPVAAAPPAPRTNIAARWCTAQENYNIPRMLQCSGFVP